MYTLRVTSETAFGTFSTIFLTKGQNITTVTAPVGAHIREFLETMRDAMIDLFLVRVGLCIRLADTFGNDACVAFRVTSVFTIFTLHSRRVFEEFTAERTAHDVVKLLRDEFVAVHLMDFLFALTYSTFSVKSSVKWPAVLCLFRKGNVQLYRPSGLEGKPGINRLRCNHSVLTNP